MIRNGCVCMRWSIMVKIAIVVFLAACILNFLQPQFYFKVYYIPDLSTHPPPSSTPTPLPPPRPVDTCSLPPASPQDAHEEQLLLNLTRWPETPPLPVPFSLTNTSHPAHSSFTILPRPAGREWRVGDQLEVLIQLKDFQGRLKRSGGDFFLARLHNSTLDAGVIGRVVDHLNGSYSAVFPLLWEGDAQVAVTMVHPSEAITLLRQVNKDHPDRIYFNNFFRLGSVSESTVCNVCLRPTTHQVCNFTDVRLGEPWFCYKPKNLSCDTRVEHVMGGHAKRLEAKQALLFNGKVNLKVSIQATGAASVNVLSKQEGQPELKSRLVVSPPAGYYYQGLWRALDGTTVRHFSTPSDISRCLKGKVVHMYGDSTTRQWFEFLVKAAPDLKEFNLHNFWKCGPRMAIDHTNNAMVTFRCHGPPLRVEKVPIINLNYVANELDGLVGGGNLVVVIGVWAHFGSYPIQVYIRRMQRIRGAVERLLRRSPATHVIIRTANVEALNVNNVLTNSDWYSVQCDKVLRAIFKGVNVRLLDAWEMTVAHRFPHNLHPEPPIIKNMVDVVLSYVCP